MIRVGIDIGNSKISIVVCDIKNNGTKKILSFISSPTNFVKKSLITDVNALTGEIHDIISKASKESETEIKTINLNVPAIESFSDFNNSQIQIAGEEINELHLKKLINESEILKKIENYEIIQKSIIGYNVDGKEYSKSPIGIFGDSVKVHFYKFAVKKNITKTFSNLFKNLNINIDSLIPTPLSSALSTLDVDDKLLGAICVDLGAASSSISLFENGKIVFMDSINVGGNNITNDIARGISTNIESAERLKTLYGSVISSPSDDYELIEVSSVGTDQSNFKKINRSTINSIIKPRVEETLELIRQKLKEYNLHNKKIKNLILTGGGSMLEGVSEYAQVIFDSNVRIGKPKPIIGLEKKYLNPQFSQTIGTIFYNKEDYEIKEAENREIIKKNNVFSRFSTWLDQYI